MKISTFKIENERIEIHQTFLGKETVYINNYSKSSKRGLFNKTHKLLIENKNYEIKYAVKNAWRKLIGQPVYLVLENGNVVDEIIIENRIFKTQQFLISFGIMLLAFTFIKIVLNAIENDFIFFAY